MEEEDFIDKDVDVLEFFTCSMSGYSNLTSINQTRYLHFKNECKPKVIRLLKMLICVCKMEQIKRSWYIVKLYKNAAVVHPLANYAPRDNGFELVDGYVYVKWSDFEQVSQGAKNDNNTVMDHSDIEYGEEEDEVTDDKESEDGDSDDDNDQD